MPTSPPLLRHHTSLLSSTTANLVPTYLKHNINMLHTVNRNALYIYYFILILMAVTGLESHTNTPLSPFFNQNKICFPRTHDLIYIN